MPQVTGIVTDNDTTKTIDFTGTVTNRKQTFYFDDRQDGMTIKNEDNVTLTLIVNGRSYTLTAKQSLDISERFISFNIVSKSAGTNKFSLTSYAFHSGTSTPLVIEDTLTSTNTKSGLSANQGRILDGKIAANTASLVDKAQKKKTDTWVDVVADFGAIGDGISDDTIKIQNAINSINKGVILLPAGTYKITQPLTLGNNKHLVGTGTFSSILQLSGASKGIDLSDVNPKTGIKISSIGIMGDNTIGQVGIDSYYVTNGSLISDIRIENTDIGLRISKSWYGAYSQFFIRNCLSYGLHIKNPTGSEQVNDITFKEMFIQGCYNSVYLQASNTSANIRFDGCTFESSKKTSVITEQVSPLSFVNCYFERNYTDAYLGTEVLVPTNPIDVKLITLSTRNVVRFDTCYFARNNNFATSTGKTSIYCDTNARVVMDACQFSCNTGGYIDYNIYSDSTIPVDFHNCTEDGYAKTFCKSVQRNTIVSFVSANDLRYTSQVSFFGQINKKGRYHLQFISKDTVTVTTRPYMKIYNAFTNAQIGSDLSFPLSYTTGTIVEFDLGIIDPSTVSLVKVAQTIASDVDVNGMTLLIYKEPQF